MDKDYKRLTGFLVEMGVGQVAHTHKSYLAHLIAVHRLLESQGGSEDVCRAGMFHSIGILSSAVFAWYHVSAMTATPPLNTRPRHSAGSGIGNFTADRTPGIVRIASKS